MVHPTMESVESVIMKIRHLFDSVNDNLGFLPFYWFSELGVSICTRLTYIIMDEQFLSNLNIIIFYLGEFTIICLFTVIYLFAVSYFQSHKPTSNHMYERVNANRLLIRPKMSIHHLDSLLNYQYRAYNMFSINIQFLFTFTASVITFTVMFIQLITPK